VVQMMVKLEEDVVDCKRRVNAMNDGGENDEMNVNDWPEARLLDLRKAYPRVNRPALWGLLERYGMNGKCLETLIDLHECTVYKVRGKEGMSEGWMPVRGLREGCSTSPILFNVFHQAVMRQAEEERSEGGEVGVAWKWVPGSAFAGAKVWESGGTEVKRVVMSSALFADDTTILGVKGEMDEGVNAMKRVMGKWEERCNDAKEEVLEFGTDEGANVRVLGSWVNAEKDVSSRIRRANGVWWRVKGMLKGSKLTKRWQAKVVEACVESSLLYDCQARMWYKKDMNRLQRWMDKCYRYVWSDRNGQPLRQMSARGMNMQDVRSSLNVKSVRWKIEKRVLERIGHVIRMGNERMTKIMVLGWYEGLEGKAKMPGKKRKTVLYWKKLLNECGVDWTDVERLCGNRDEWKKVVKERMNHVDVWERQRGHRYEWQGDKRMIDRNERRVIDFVCRYEGCGKVCRSKAGLVMHQKWKHRAPRERVTFQCGKCGVNVETEVARMAHERTCGGGGVDGNRRECEVCGVWITKANYARHVRVCRERAGVDVRADVGPRGRRESCPLCGVVVSRSNMARHQRSCRVWDPAGGPNS